MLCLINKESLLRKKALLVEPVGKPQTLRLMNMDAVEALLDGLSLHDFAGNLIRDFCARRGLSPEETAADEAALARMLRRALFG